MGLKALIVLELHNVTEDQRNIFYEALETNTWTKFKHLTNAWEAIFNDRISRPEALDILDSDLQIAKRESDILKIEYAIQLHAEEIINSK